MKQPQKMMEKLLGLGLQIRPSYWISVRLHYHQYGLVFIHSDHLSEVSLMNQ